MIHLHWLPRPGRTKLCLIKSSIWKHKPISITYQWQEQIYGTLSKDQQQPSAIRNNNSAPCTALIPIGHHNNFNILYYLITANTWLDLPTFPFPLAPLKDHIPWILTWSNHVDENFEAFKLLQTQNKIDTRAGWMGVWWNGGSEWYDGALGTKDADGKGGGVGLAWVEGSWQAKRWQRLSQRNQLWAL